MPDAKTELLHRPRVEDLPKPASNNSNFTGAGILDPAAQSFISANALEPWLPLAYALIDKAFASHQAITIEKKTDPEIQDEWLNLRIKVNGPLDAVVDAYDAFTAQMVQALPAAVSSKIRLSLTVS